MFLVLTVKPVGLKKIDEVLRDIQEGIAKTQDESAPAALALAISTLEDRFLDEGPPQWKELAPSTQRQRAALGYGPTGPILRRSGDLLRSLTDTSDPMNIHRIRRYSRRTVGVLGTKDPRYPELQWGTILEGGNIPARWMWPTGQEEQYLMNDIEDDLTEKLVKNARLNKHRTMRVR